MISTKKFLKNRVLPIVCALSILTSLCVTPASAIALETAITGMITGLGLGASILEFCEDIGLYYKNDDPEDFGKWWCTPALAAGRIKSGNCTNYSIETLELIANDWNNNYGHGVDSSIPEQYKYCHAEVLMLDGTNRFVIAFRNMDADVETAFGLVLTYHDGTVLSSAVVDPEEDTEFVPIWGPRSRLTSMPKQMVSREQLANYATDYGGSMQHYGDYWIVFEPEHGSEVLCAPNGRPLATFYEEDKAAINQDRPGTTITDENGNKLEIDGDAEINMNDMTIALPDGLFAYIDQLVYDESTKTYYIDASTTTNIDEVNITNNYYFKWEYHINYTSVTYIGQTEEYDKYYEVYYELPDGRDSADLTREELEQLNLSIDVIPYVRSADDTSLRSLYHFDGDTDDASYWNYCTDFTWNTGASLTYMDAGVFNGALYLDENEHDFTITLPSILSADDFTLQFRYYQSYTPTPVKDSYISIGNQTIMCMTGSEFTTHGSMSVGQTPIGTWNEIAVIRSNGVVYWYLNGVCSVSGSGLGGFSFLDEITFHFGSEQQTYKYLDELRVLNYAIASGENYEPTAVPHDTNLSLVLPTDKVAIADEYWSITHSGDNLFKYDVDSGLSAGFSSISPGKNITAGYYPNWGHSSQLQCVYHTGYVTITSTNSSHYVNGVQNSSGAQLETMVGSSSSGGWSGTGGLEWDTDYVLSVVLEDGTINSFPFTLSDSTVTSRSADFEWGSLGLRNIWVGTNVTVVLLYIKPTVNVPVNIRKIVLTKGSETDLKAEWIESVVVIDKGDLNTPTLAVRTDLEITSHQIGGVRPSIPSKGQVWVLVENQRITSIQIYNGQAWEGVDGRIWTGSRWIPASSYNIITLQDMYDIVDGTPNYEYIYTESGFWAWWQKSWNAFTEKLFSLLGSGGSGGGGNQETNNYDFDSDVIIIAPGEESGKSFWQFVLLCVDGGKAVVKGVRYLFDGVVSNVPDSMDSITQSFDSGGSAVSITEGKDPDAADMPEAAFAVDESEVLDPWRYR